MKGNEMTITPIKKQTEFTKRIRCVECKETTTLNECDENIDDESVAVTYDGDGLVSFEVAVSISLDCPECGNTLATFEDTLGDTFYPQRDS